MSISYETNEDIKIFQEYLRIPSVQPDVDYGNYLYLYLYL